MPKGISLHIGLNRVDPAHYAGWSGPLNACEADANDMQAIAAAQGFQTQVLLTAQGTRTAVLQSIRSAAATLKSGDFYLLSYSGHGGQIPDFSGDEDDLQDETWCLYDGQFLDDELHAELVGLAAGVRVLVFSDSCHSGTVTKNVMCGEKGLCTPEWSGPFGVRAMPQVVALNTYQNNRKFYDELPRLNTKAEARDDVKASTILISGCQDNQLSGDGAFNGVFTGRLRRVWNGGSFQGDYRAFHAAILKGMPPSQSPNYYTIGTPDPSFEKQRPFTI